MVHKEIKPRANWFVYDAGQDPIHCLWYCTLCSFDLEDEYGNSACVSVEECYSFSRAIEQANKLAEKLEKKHKRS